MSLLVVQGLSMRFGGIIALNRVNLTVASGSITALIGPNGAGKTTVFNCITGFYRGGEGRILLHRDGRVINLGALLGGPFVKADFGDPRRLAQTLVAKLMGGPHRVARAGVARTFQNIRLFREMTAIENLLVACHGQVNRNLVAGVVQTKAFRRAEAAALERALAELDFLDLLADGNRLAGELPYGHQRRLEIGRALCTDPLLLCLDEPAAGLNPNETRELSSMIRRLRDERGLTVLLIEHDMELVMAISDHVVVLDHGEVIAAGDPEEVGRDPKVLAAYLGVAAP